MRLTELEFKHLADYNAEVARGVVHTPEWDARMAELQERFDQSMRRTPEPDIPDLPWRKW